MTEFIEELIKSETVTRDMIYFDTVYMALFNRQIRGTLGTLKLTWKCCRNVAKMQLWSLCCLYQQQIVQILLLKQISITMDMQANECFIQLLELLNITIEKAQQINCSYVTECD